MTTSSNELPGVRLNEFSIQALDREDVDALHRILIDTGAFTDEETAVAIELLESSLRDPEGDYQVRVVSTAGRAIGYACFGRAPFTQASYDLYWIALDPAWYGSGAARLLMSKVEEEIRGRGGKLVLVETASKPSYARTRRFYEAIGYCEVAHIRDYYRSGDDKIVYEKRWA